MRNQFMGSTAMTFTPKLTKAERKLIRKIAKLQLVSLTRLLTCRVEEVDLSVHCMEHEISEASLRRELHGSYEQFAILMDEPTAFFNLDSDNLSISRALLLGPLSQHLGRRKLWRKIRVHEKHTDLLHSN